VRFLIGDTISTAQLMQNEEINAVLAYQPSPVYAAAACADALGARFSRDADLSIGATSVSASQRAAGFHRLADRLRAGGAGNLPGGDGTGVANVSMFVGGLSIAGNDALAEDDDTVKSQFAVGQDDNPSTPNGLRDDERFG